jgi:hypothetical protein
MNASTRRIRALLLHIRETERLEEEEAKRETLKKFDNLSGYRPSVLASNSDARLANHQTWTPSSLEPAVAIELRGSTVFVAVGQAMSDGGIDILGYASRDSSGMSDGKITDSLEFDRAVEGAIDEAELISGVDIESVFVGLAGRHVSLAKCVVGTDLNGVLDLDHIRSHFESIQKRHWRSEGCLDIWAENLVVDKKPQPNFPGTAGRRCFFDVMGALTRPAQVSAVRERLVCAGLKVSGIVASDFSPGVGSFSVRGPVSIFKRRFGGLASDLLLHRVSVVDLIERSYLAMMNSSDDMASASSRDWNSRG